MIIGINGKLRQGKGILATFLSLCVAEQGTEVLSNYWIDSPNAEKIDFYGLLSLLEKPRQEPQKLIVIDEIHGWLDSYVGQSKAGRFGSYFVFQSAKLGYDLIYTTQLTMRAINTLRELCDLRLYAQKDVVNEQFLYHLLDINEPNDDIPTGQTLTIPFSIAQLFWNRYNTYEGVKPIGLKEILASIVKFDVPRMDETINRQVRLLQSQIGTEQLKRGISKLSVESWLISLGEPTDYANLVSFRLKEQQYKTNISSRQAQPQPEHHSNEIDSRQQWLKLQSKLS